jgi:putative SOS response-associated peptidase YedK
MCGRYSFAPDLKIVNQHYDIKVDDGTLIPNYNCAPTQLLTVLTNETPGQLSFFRWGLVPFWAKDVSIGNKLINARAETILEKPSFKQSFRHRRCLVPADSFYEWKANVTGKKKTPYRIFLKDQPLFSMAGIWDVWKSPTGETIRSFSIITTSPNEMMAGIHNRMPVILPAKFERFWLEATNEKDLLELLQPFASDKMDYVEVSDFSKRYEG